MKIKSIQKLKLVKNSVAILNEKNQNEIVGGTNNDPMSNSRCITSCRTR
ncbi:hypothetical protein H2O64_07215 [Kordia sp. YSTF-M3]|uniref:Bacteriocin n=1 Tax=Kordia aestuariivivens TaxID=2759037 RepID=A0ABR7Q7A3_9FLAO|nr:hypothetical protein [Kordia aestuariivivens]MBC8754456.1 hypothetical protein [Kordia aestuariivivens]